MDPSASPQNPSAPPQASLRSAPSPPPQPSPPPAQPLPAPPLPNLCFPPRFPRRQTTGTAGSTSGTGRPPLGVRTSRPALRIPAGQQVHHRPSRQQTRCQSQGACRRRAPGREPNVRREKSRPAAARHYNPRRRTRLHPQDLLQHQPPATQRQRAAIQPRRTPRRGQSPRQQAQTPPACSTAPESPIAPPPTPAQFASPRRPRRRHVQHQFRPCSLRTQQPNLLLLTTRSQANLTRQAPAAP